MGPCHKVSLEVRVTADVSGYHQENWYIKIPLEELHMKPQRRLEISTRQPMVLGAVAASSNPHKCHRPEDPKGLGHDGSHIGSVRKWTIPQNGHVDRGK